MCRCIFEYCRLGSWALYQDLFLLCWIVQQSSIKNNDIAENGDLKYVQERIVFDQRDCSKNFFPFSLFWFFIFWSGGRLSFLFTSASLLVSFQLWVSQYDALDFIRKKKLAHFSSDEFCCFCFAYNKRRKTMPCFHVLYSLVRGCIKSLQFVCTK